MSTADEKLISRLLPKPVGSPIGPPDDVKPTAALHSSLRAAVNVSSEQPLLSAQASIKVVYYQQVQYAGQVLGVNSGIQLSQDARVDSVLIYACITKLMRLLDKDGLWVAEIVPLRDVIAFMGALSAIPHTHDLTPLPKQMIWLNHATAVATNLVPDKCGPGRANIAWIIPQN
jgi:hypothetical protein